MTQIGILRKVDALGRVTLPKEFRRVFRLNKDDEIEILATEEGILLRIPNIEVRQINTDKGELPSLRGHTVLSL
ncbi:MAG: AbrB/MazE/SpoVT family DNA-binding domain-containing protein [Ruminococcaceae bacterium]|nr:AbrB/MazE/SpoVT family DNA-binding domain-containing protein [Oscillospiraceae bacterium]